MARETFPTKLSKATRLLYRPQAIDSIMLADGSEVLIHGQDFKIDENGSVEILNEAFLDKDAVIVYQR